MFVKYYMVHIQHTHKAIHFHRTKVISCSHQLKTVMVVENVNTINTFYNIYPSAPGGED